MFMNENGQVLKVKLFGYFNALALLFTFLLLFYMSY